MQCHRLRRPAGKSRATPAVQQPFDRLQVVAQCAQGPDRLLDEVVTNSKHERSAVGSIAPSITKMTKTGMSKALQMIWPATDQHDFCGHTYHFNWLSE